MKDVSANFEIVDIKDWCYETRVVNKYKESYDVYIGRGSKWGNPFTHISDKKTKADFVVASRDEAIESYRDWVVKQSQLLKDLHELRGKTLGCFCKPKRCHGDVLVELVNGLGEWLWKMLLQMIINYFTVIA